MTLYHYSNNDTLLSMLVSQELWLSDLALSNDTMEGRWLRHVFVEYCKSRSVGESTINELLPFLDHWLESVGTVGFCLSEKGDLLSQWRGYADSGHGISIGFSQRFLEDVCTDRPNSPHLIRLRKVTYAEKEQLTAVSETADKILQCVEDGALRRFGLLMSEEEQKSNQQKYEQMVITFLHLFPHLFTLKNPAFQEEQEWRLTSVFMRSHKDDPTGEMRSMEFRATRDKFVPCKKIRLSDYAKPSIEEVILGPKNITPDSVVMGMLARHGIEGVRVKRSTATYR